MPTTTPTKDISLKLVDTVEIASPCSARWEEMTLTGDERVRRCEECRLNVHDLSGMSEREAEALLASYFGEGGKNAGRRLCAQWRRRADGTIIFGDCPVGLARVRAAARRSVARVCAAIGVTALVAATAAWATKNGWNPRQYASFTAVSGWIGTKAVVRTVTVTATGGGAGTRVSGPLVNSDSVSGGVMVTRGKVARARMPVTAVIVTTPTAPAPKTTGTSMQTVTTPR